MRDHDRRSGFQPPWWPEDEPFPPELGEWRGMRGHFLRRLAIGFAIFFLFVGLEIKREFQDGRLSIWSQRRLPFMAAGAGMAVLIVVSGILTALVGLGGYLFTAVRRAEDLLPDVVQVAGARPRSPL